MTTQLAIRLDAGELEALDTEVVEGRAANRSVAVRAGSPGCNEISASDARRPP